MCGIVGSINTGRWNQYDADQRNKVFSEMLFSDTLRGFDSTGLFAAGDVPRRLGKPEVKMVKWASPAPAVIWSKEYKKWITQAVQWHPFMVGHNRWATKGKVNKENAHPFQHGPITMVHNGTLTDYGRLPNAHQFATDSEAVCHALATMNIKDVLAKITGAYVFVWHDTRDNKLRIIRNSQRPLTLARHLHSEKIWFASEGRMLNWILNRNKIADGQYKTYTLNPGDLMTINAQNCNDWGVEGGYLPKPLTPATGSNGGTSYTYNDAGLMAKKIGFETDTRVVGKVVGMREFGAVRNGYNRNFEMTFEAVDYSTKDKDVYMKRHNIMYSELVQLQEVWGGRSIGPDWALPEIEKEMLGHWVTCIPASFNESTNYHLSPTVCVPACISGSVKYDTTTAYATLEEAVIKAQKPSVKQPPKERAANKTLPGERGMVRLTDHHTVSIGRWKVLTSVGCAECGHVPNIGEADGCFWVDQTTFLCGECVAEWAKKDNEKVIN